MYEYLFINLGIIIFPLLFSFEKRLRFYQKLPAVASSILIGGTIYITWDFFATARGDWGFNEAYITGIKLANLPLEEILFFVTAPYSCLFIYEALSTFLRERQLNVKKYYFFILASGLIILGVYYWDQSYTATALVITGVFFVLVSIFSFHLLQSLLYWLYCGIVIIPFIIFNYFLTSLPVVTYGASAIWGVRILTIPAEDFFFNFSMLSFHVLIYIFVKSKIKNG
jgi:lycopene cyclase domain-containing protein